MASSSSSSPSPLPAVSVTREEFNAFHKCDRALFTRLVVTLRRDISQSLQVMSFLLYLEKSGLISNLIVNLVSLPDYFTISVAEEVMMCLNCLSYEGFSTFLANSGTNINSSTIPLITRMTRGYFTLQVIHEDRENILLAMKKYLTSICYPAFEDICARAEMNNKESAEMEKAMDEKMKQLGINRVVHKPESSCSQFLSEQQGASKVGAFSVDEQAREDGRTVFLTFSKGYPISEAEVHAYFTRRFGEIIEAIIMPGGEGNEQALYAKMVLHSAALIPEIVSDAVTRTKYTINGKHVWARKYIPRSSLNNLSPSNGVSL
ncbi:hypothetical protein CARUB_v10003585mg [Capsella rubella]|uniref:Uncharacterized protein n=1 Tax=Capsella rubella TaxID=81985 RepID=R0HCU3_9BRAS|nr:uncharacterized protein LOC17883058 [Capsella rubella]EOA22855.1 hypothetical protein CARUB_v10003585mg [Capsella rubella]